MSTDGDLAAARPLPDPARIRAGTPAGQVILKPRKAQPFFGRHPWVLNSAVASLPDGALDGDVVDLLTDKGKFVARGILNRGSRIQVRLYSWDPDQPLDEGFWRQRLVESLQLRKVLGLDGPEGAARIVFGESDGLSGIIVDRYADHLVVQVNALAMQLRYEMILGALVELTGAVSVTLRSEPGMVELEGMSKGADEQHGQVPDEGVLIEEHGIRYRVDVRAGQKTGFYLDQRENRRIAATYLRDREVLDVFCYTGGFSLNAVKAGARRCIGIDGSQRAIELAQANAELNGLTDAHFERADCFRRLEQLTREARQFDAVILDPPKFTRGRRKVEEALRAYYRINRLAVDLLRSDGILVTCSCTGSVTREDLMFVLSAVSQKSGRTIQVLEQRGPAADHAVSATCLESDYLKCFICLVR